MTIQCTWEHNENDTLLYAANLPGAYTRGESKEATLMKMQQEAASYLKWTGKPVPKEISIQIYCA